MESHIIHSFVVVDRVQQITVVLLLCCRKSNLQLLGRGGGLMPREAAKGAFQLDCFQNMDDPLPDLDATFGPLIKDISYDLI